MNQPHLDDEQLSAELDGYDLDEAGRSHLDACEACAGRLGELATASRLVATPVAALDPARVDALMARAVAAGLPEPGRPAPVTDLQNQRDVRARSGRRVRPPGAWIAGAAAALALLAGLAGLTQTVSGRGDRPTALGAQEDDATPAAEAAAGSTSPFSLDPAVVTADLGDQQDPALLVAALSAVVASAASPAAAPPDDAAGDAADRPVRATPTAEAQVARRSGRSGDTAHETALCVEAARHIGAGRLGGHLSTSTLRWKQEPAEVLVFELTEPSGGLSRQALVLRRPGCDLLADPRF
ncbi:MAG: hypothetical protein KY454_01195 [Actinobacteria bacterium]|nr:hypothetical protein [Actinomycetota bacterium]